MCAMVEVLHFVVWGPWTLVLLLGTGLWFTARSGFFQLRGVRCWWRATAGSLWNGDPGREEKAEKGRITRFQSACTALAATIGTGNIVGVATALTAGGPGALFWMWVSAAIGMMTAYAETFLGQRYRYRQSNGEWMCGPMVYMERGMGCPLLGKLYALFAVLASLGMGSMVQSNSMSGTLEFGAGIPPILSALLITLLTGAVILGGIQRISRVSVRLMPISAGVYVVFSLIVILSCRECLPQVMADIFREAFCLEAAGGGITGFLLSRSVRYGMSRGVFSNEAGLGSLSVLHGAAEDTTPAQQGMWAMFEVFFDTIVICTLTALVILCVTYSGAGGYQGGSDGAALTASCFSARLGEAGEVLVSAAMVIFAFATIIAWYYLGRQSLSYLLERPGRRKGQADIQSRGYLALYLLAVFCGSVCRLEVVWLISDLWNGLMAYPNLLALLWLSRQVLFPADFQGFVLDKSRKIEYTDDDKRE